MERTSPNNRTEPLCGQKWTYWHSFFCMCNVYWGGMKLGYNNSALHFNAKCAAYCNTETWGGSLLETKSLPRFVARCAPELHGDEHGTASHNAKAAPQRSLDCSRKLDTLHAEHKRVARRWWTAQQPLKASSTRKVSTRCHTKKMVNYTRISPMRSAGVHWSA